MIEQASETGRANLQARLPPDIYQTAWEQGEFLKLEEIAAKYLKETKGRINPL